MTRCTLLILILGSVLSLPLHADMTAANNALSRGDYQAAVKEFTRLAESGDVKAQSFLGYLYYAGEGVARDYGQAVRWYRKAAQQGDRDAQYNLAVAYAFGNGVEQDYGKAAEWYRKAAEQGHPAAQYSLGLSYARGEGVQQDRAAAMDWFRQAAAQGYANADRAVQALQDAAPAQPAAGGAPQADRKAVKLLSMEGIEPNLPGAETPTREMLDAPPRDKPAVTGKPFEDASARDSREEIQEDVTPRFQSLEDNAAGGTGLDAATGSGGRRPPAQEAGLDGGTGAALAGGQENGTAGAAAAPGPQEEGAGSFLKRLFGRKGTAATGTAAAGNGAGGMHAAAEPAAAPESPEAGDSGTAADQDAADPALYQRGMTALQNKNYREAATAFHDAAVQGDDRCQFRLGSLFYQGLGVTRDFSEAARWFRRAAENGNADAQYSLGNMYLMGEGVEQNDQQAAFWYQKAADQGHDSARHNLDNLKRIMKQSGERPGVAAGAAPAGAGGAEPAPDHKQDRKGFFSRWFGQEATDKTAHAGADEPTASRKTAATGGGGDGDKPSYLSKEGGGLLGHLFSRDGDDGDKPRQSDAAGPEQAQNGKAPAADQQKDSPSYLSKEGGGLLGHLFGWGRDDGQPQQGARARPVSAGQTVDTAGAAAYDKGLAYDRGDGVQPDPARAFKWFLQAAGQGNTEAQYRVGLAYAYGKGTDRDLEQALNWYLRAARGGHAIAQRNLATMYARGEGVREDKTRALAWYSLLAESGNAMDVRRRDILARELSPEEIANSRVVLAGLKSEMANTAAAP